MEYHTALNLLRPGIQPQSGTWADLGAGTGLFTQVLFELLESGKVIALDKSPHLLWRLQSPSKVDFEILDADFTRPFFMDNCDGILLANALHYTNDPIATLTNILAHLKVGGTLLVLEYDTQTARPPWVPYPISINRFEQLAKKVGLEELQILNKIPSQFGHSELYLASCRKK